MYVLIFGYLVNKLEIWWVYLSPIEKKIQSVTSKLTNSSVGCDNIFPKTGKLKTIDIFN